MDLKQNKYCFTEESEVWFWLLLLQMVPNFLMSWAKNVPCTCLTLQLGVNFCCFKGDQKYRLDGSVCRPGVICYWTCVKAHGHCKSASLCHLLLTPLKHLYSRHQLASEAGASAVRQAGRAHMPVVSAGSLAVPWNYRSIVQHDHEFIESWNVPN